MNTKTEKKEKQLTDADVKRKAVKLVVAHLKRKANTEFMGMEYLQAWLEDMEALLEKEEFDIKEYHRMRRQFNDVIESTLDENMRKKLRDSWYSMGKALEKKAKPY
ncbi:hypothetical protein Cst_c14810 [Thermoclostridium stercorarium subsp. stercorarium DSM 8532]|jgi:predicted secreted protein|uniref:Uncharacterized protein n=3 Tax=Thermoclostridium stercorarium TaxID=1510 RepID=L7VK11_THES1|nr:hypothetical protein [Thermoclostridium stercorarium]AGC68470.1 hypothetical protein Cst_c14810 [Thermoclostridium stercorarium subsp. stercorarium DSM 8532]AGI39488.1 hypothetical protein Clst_1429 [Thermoclostridium stercorarium subsp. stercorarium DSM 8532]ANW98835.1 hypothetical protein CSTERTH_07255 [Thermoclostridium stercorarium subsp. thermolacticum DSM 2910]ANX01360.1 hypothetical protein CSTERLE_07145 [Thermoclostridium stercorarium subsp. leptospartum DSM 9219]UZQ84460.1 hypothet